MHVRIYIRKNEFIHLVYKKLLIMLNNYIAVEVTKKLKSLRKKYKLVTIKKNNFGRKSKQLEAEILFF